MKKILLAVGLSLLLIGCAPEERDFKSNVPVVKPLQQLDKPLDKQPDQPLDHPSEINLNVPFYSQAPDADWNLPWKEACEEASLILAHAYVTNQNLTLDAFRQKVLSMVDWQTQTFGYFEDTDIEHTARILKEHLGFSDFEVVENVTVDILKRHLAQGSVIVAPFAGRRLGNPFYSGEGPVYHMMVLRGYDETHFITNDVGTRRGENFIYTYERIMDSLHDWNPRDVNLGAQNVIVLKKL